MVELMVVVIIMAILGMAVMPALMGSSEKAKYSRAWNDINAIANAFTAYYGRQGTLPDIDITAGGALETLLANDSLFQSFLGTPLENLKDPWGNSYQIAGKWTSSTGEGYVIVYVGNGTGSVDFGGTATVESGVRVDPYNNGQPMAKLVINVM